MRLLARSAFGATVAFALLAAPSVASAVTRYAAPGGTAMDTVCTVPQTPCSIGVAAGGPDVRAADEAVILPGNYTDADLDGDVFNPTNHTVEPTAGTVHGEFGSARPVITLGIATASGAFFLINPTTLSHVEIDTAVSSRNIINLDGTVEDLISRSATPGAIACDSSFANATIVYRDSACLSSGADSVAIGTSVGTSAGTFTAHLRNVTAIATGSGSLGLDFSVQGVAGTNYTVDGKGVIARGVAGDARVAALSQPPHDPNTGPHTTVTLDHSNYGTADAITDAGGGTAAITTAGSGTNQTGTPLLAADGYHQLAGSPTIDAGELDASSGIADIDGQSRTIGQLPDIGADEFEPLPAPPPPPPAPGTDVPPATTPPPPLPPQTMTAKRCKRKHHRAQRAKRRCGKRRVKQI
jgi:hypothetical protein